MARTAQISKEKRQSIITLKHEGQSIRKMSRTLKVSSSAVAKTIKRYDETGSHEDRQRKGRPRVTSLEVIRVTSPNKCFTVQVTDTSQHQLFRGDSESGLHGWIAAKKPLLKDTNKKKRLLWCGSALFVTLSVIYLEFTLNHHGYHSILQRYAIPSGFPLVGLSVFLTEQWSNTPPGCVRAILQRRMECDIKWPGLHNPPTSTQLRWFRMSQTVEVKEKQPTSAQHMWKLLQDCWKRMPRVCKAVKAKGGYFKNLKYKIYFDLFNTFLVTTWFHMCVISLFWCLHYYSTM